MSFNYTYKPSTNSLDVTTPDNANVTINSGDNGSVTGDGGDFTLSASDGGSTSGDGGEITLRAGSVTSGVAGDININAGVHSGGGSDGTINILGDGYTSNNFDITGSLIASGITYPTSDGSNGQAIVTDGAGNLSFASGLMSYTVGTSASGARFSTIQAAIDQAVSDGADANNPAEIIIFPGFYSENLTASNGGIALSGIANEWGVYISGTITFTNDGSASNIWMLSNIGVDGAIAVNGTSGGSFLALEIENCSLFGQVSVADASAQIRVKSSKIVTNSADPIVVNNTTSAKPIRLFDSKITGVPAGRALLISAGDIRNCSIVGHVEVTDNTSFNCLVGTCIIYTSGNPGVITNNSSNIVEITNCTISRTGSAGTLISKSGSGELQRTGNSFLGNVTDPPVTVLAGTDTVGNYIEREIGPYSFPTSSTNIFSMPGTDGSNGQAIVTDGYGNLSFASTGASDHGELTGLTDDDHTHYLLADGSRAMSGNLDMGSNDITVVGSVDGVDFSNASSRSVLARSANSFGQSAWLQGSNNQVLRVESNAVSFGEVTHEMLETASGLSVIGRTDNSSGSYGTIQVSSNEILGTVANPFTSSALQLTGHSPNWYEFVCTESSSGNYTLRVAPETFGSISALGDGYSDTTVVEFDSAVNYAYSTDDGFYEFTVSALAKGTSGDYYKTGAGLAAILSSNVFSAVGNQVDYSSFGDGLTLICTVSGHDLTVELQNDTTEEIDARIHVGWERQDLIT